MRNPIAATATVTVAIAVGIVVSAMLATLATPALAQDAATAAAKPHVAKKSGTIDCNKTPNVHIGNGKLKLTFTGRCASVSIGSGMNEIVADTIVHLEVAGASNRVFVTAIDSMNLVGAKNDITWTGVVDTTKTEPAVTSVGKDNVVKRGDRAIFDAARKTDSKTVNAEAKKSEAEAQKAVDDAKKQLDGLGIKLN